MSCSYSWWRKQSWQSCVTRFRPVECVVAAINVVVVVRSVQQEHAAHLPYPLPHLPCRPFDSAAHCGHLSRTKVAAPSSRSLRSHSLIREASRAS